MKRTLALFLALAMLLSMTASALAYMDGTGIPGNWPAPFACNHSYYLDDTIINGCTSPVIYIYRCSRCGDVYREQGPAPGHDYRNQGSVAATCTSPGYDEYVCSRCGDSYQVPTPALGHNWGGWYQTKAPSCTENGEEQRACSRCGLTESRSIPGYGGHDWGEWKVEVPGDCVTIELRYRKCSRCGETQYQNWGYGDHDWDNGWTETIQAPNCTYPGKAVLHCAIESSHTQETEIPIDPEAHDWGEWEVVEPATPDSPGLERRVCKINPDHVEERDLLYSGPTNPPFVAQPGLKLTGSYSGGPFKEGESFTVYLTLENTGNVALYLDSYEANPRDDSGDCFTGLPSILEISASIPLVATCTVTAEDVADGIYNPVTGLLNMDRYWLVRYNFVDETGNAVPLVDSYEIAPDIEAVPQNLYAGLRMMVSMPSPSKEWYSVSDSVSFDITLNNVGNVDLDDCQAIILDGDGTTYTVDFGNIPAWGTKTMPWTVVINDTHLAHERDLISFAGQGWVPKEILDSGVEVAGHIDGRVVAAPIERDLPVKDGPPWEEQYSLKLEVVNTAPKAAYYLDDIAEFLYTITNTSTETVKDITLSVKFDSYGTIYGYIETLAPGESVSRSLDFTVLQVDVDYAAANGWQVGQHWFAQGYTDDMFAVPSNNVGTSLPIGETPPEPVDPITQITITNVANGSGAGKTVGDWVEATITVKNTGNVTWEFNDTVVFYAGFTGEEFDMSAFSAFVGSSYAPGEELSATARIKVTPEDMAAHAVIRVFDAFCKRDGYYYDSNNEQCNILLDGVPPTIKGVTIEPELILSVTCTDSDPFWFNDEGHTGDIHYQAVVTYPTFEMPDADPDVTVFYNIVPLEVRQIVIATDSGVKPVDVGPYLLYPGDSTPNIPLTNDFTEADKRSDNTLHIAFMAVAADPNEANYASNTVELTHNLVDLPPWIPPTVELTVEKYEASVRPTPLGYRMNDVVDYEIWVFNNSEVTIPQIDVFDPLYGSGIVGTIYNLAPYSWDYVPFSYTVQDYDVDNKKIENTAYILFTDPEAGVECHQDSNTLVVPTTKVTDTDALYGVSIKITFGKEPANGSYYVEGEHIPITVDWKNTSDQTLYKVEVYDSDAWITGAAPGGCLVDGGTLAPGETGTFTYDYVVDNYNTEMYKYVNDFAYIYGYDKDGYDYYADDYVTKPADVDPPTPPVVIGPSASLKVEKIETSTPAVNPAYYTEGETITYEITVTNTGGADLYDVLVGDTLNDSVDGVFASIEILHAGESRKYPFSHKVTADDVHNTRVVNYAVGYYNWEELKNIPVFSDPVISPTGPQPGPVPPGTPGYDPDPGKPTGHVDTPIVKEGQDDACVLTLKAKGDGAAEYEQHLCSKHYAAYQQGTEEAWKAALDELYGQILAASSGSARAAVMAERAAFYAYVDSVKATALKLNTRDAQNAEQNAVRMLMDHCAELCYVTHFAPEDRPDSLVFGKYKTIASSHGERCVTGMAQAEGTNLILRENLCEAHTQQDAGTRAMLKKAQTRAMAADVFFRARRGWQAALNQLVTEEYKATPKEDRSYVAACRALFDEMMAKREELYTFIYAGHPETVNEIMNRSTMLDVIRRCK